jgi:hypothetical protein
MHDVVGAAATTGAIAAKKRKKRKKRPPQFFAAFVPSCGQQDVLSQAVFCVIAVQSHFGSDKANFLI